jgi:hypothetical protein
MQHIDIIKYELDLEKMLSLPIKKQCIVLELFNDMLRRVGGGGDYEVIGTQVIAKTLITGGYLVTTRDRKITSFLEDDSE